MYMSDLERLPLSTLNTGAIALHELFLSLTGAGFTEEQALDMVVRVMLNLTDTDPKAV